ncbi:MAG: hypothetical protein GX657_03480, partial [Chloroflexi bacterium]|nr:hypothetical protein [Chloroflexota bacterium]
PNPTDGATSRPLTVALDWADAYGATSYDVYLGTTATPWKVATTTASVYAPISLASNTLYYWKVVAKSACGETAGPVWSFTTCRKPDIPWSPAPADGATNRSVTANLNWSDSYAATSYDVYFGTYSGPPKIGTSTVSSYNLPALAFGQRYYWKIVARNPCGDTSGPEWEFTTRAPTDRVVLPLVRY